MDALNSLNRAKVALKTCCDLSGRRGARLNRAKVALKTDAFGFHTLLPPCLNRAKVALKKKAHTKNCLRNLNCLNRAKVALKTWNKKVRRCLYHPFKSC